jgi:hypothetical protein
MKKLKQNAQMSLRMPASQMQWLENTASALGVDKTQLVRYALGQLQAEIEMAKQMRSQLSSSGMSLQQVEKLDVAAKPKAIRDSITKELEALLASQMLSNVGEPSPS